MASRYKWCSPDEVVVESDVDQELRERKLTENDEEAMFIFLVDGVVWSTSTMSNCDFRLRPMTDKSITSDGWSTSSFLMTGRRAELETREARRRRERRF